MANVFKDAKERLKDIKEGTRKCVVCGVDEDTIEITSYYKLDYCPTHLALAKKDKKKKGITAEQLLEKLEDMKTEILAAIKSNAPVASAEITSSALSKKTMLRMLYKARDLIPRDFHSVFGKENAITVRNMLMEMARVDIFVYNKNGQELNGRLLWKNEKSHYMINPNLPRDSFEHLTEISVNEEDYKNVMKELLRKSRSAVFKYKQWDAHTGKWVFLA